LKIKVEVEIEVAEGQKGIDALMQQTALAQQMTEKLAFHAVDQAMELGTPINVGAKVTENIAVVITVTP
jgi:hypothetical protein